MVHKKKNFKKIKKTPYREYWFTVVDTGDLIAVEGKNKKEAFKKALKKAHKTKREDLRLDEIFSW